MNKRFLKTIATVMVMFAMVATAVATPTTSATAVSFDSQLDTDFNTDPGDGFGDGFGDDFGFSDTDDSSTTDNNETSATSGGSNTTPDDGSSASDSSATFIECSIDATQKLITEGETTLLEWQTENASKVLINGEEVSKHIGSLETSPLFTDTTFELEAFDGNGSSCLAKVVVNCDPPEEPKLCEPGDQHYDPENDLSGKIYAEGKGRVTNDSEYCDYKVGLASYEKFDEVIDNQRFFDDDTGIVSANGHRELTVDVPACAYQIDLFYGHVLKSLDGQRYGERLLDADHVNGKNYCGTITKPECPYTSADGTVIDFTDARIYSSRGAMNARTEPQAVNLPVGTYAVQLVAWDGYTDRVNVSQPNEQYKVVVTNDVNVVAETNSTSDLEDRVATALFDAQVNSELEISSAGTYAYALHSVYPDKSSPNSLNPICAVFEKQDEPEQPVAPECPLTAKDGRTIVNFDGEKLRTDKGEGQSRTVAQAFDFPAGEYDITLVSWDGYRDRINATQPNEQWELQFLSDGSLISASNAIGDLEDKVLEAQKTEQVNTGLTLTTAADAVRAYHSFYPTNASPNSLYPICAAIDAVPAEPVPSCDSLTATPGAITVGDTVTLAWETSNATDVFINNGVGAVDLDGSVEVSPLEDTTYVMTVFGTEDQSVDCEVPVTVSEDPVPVCTAFTATPDALPVGGGEVTLDWEVGNAETVSISPIVGTTSDLVSSQTVSVTESTTFTLTATDDNGDTVSCQAPVAVADPEPPFTCADNVDFTASDTSIDRGDSLTLTWSTTNVDTVSISNLNTDALSGSETVSPSSDTTYVLTATRGEEQIECPVAIDVSRGGGGGGGGGSASPRCDLEISKTEIEAGEQITLEWETTSARSVTLIDDEGEVLFTTDDYLARDKEDFYDGSITLEPTRDTEYTLIAERGNRDRECRVEVEVEDDDGGVTVLETRDQEPLVAGISLSQVPYTGFEAGPFMTFMFYALLVAWSLFLTYLLVIRNRTQATHEGVVTETAPTATDNGLAMKQAEATRPDVFAPSVTAQRATPTATAPSNLPTGAPTTETSESTTAPVVNAQPHQADDALVTELENRAHTQKALLSSDAVRYFVSTTEGTVERNQSLDTVIAEAKKHYPLEDGWLVINEARMRELCTTCELNQTASSHEPYTPATVPTGTGSLAEAIVTGNVVAAYEMIGNRPMFALADAAADLDAVYRSRQGSDVTVSELLLEETKELSDAQIKNMINALTGALDGTYTDEASAVKMAIMKAIKEIA